MKSIIYLPTTTSLSIKEAVRVGQESARICYSEKGPEEIAKEKDMPKMMYGNVIPNEHFSTLEHSQVTRDFVGIPKILAMVLNDEVPYITSEKSGRYARMTAAEKRQRKLYDKWKERLWPAILESGQRLEKRKSRGGMVQGPINHAEKLAMENARYMNSVFTPATNMRFTVSFVQHNIVVNKMKQFMDEHDGSGNLFYQRLIEECFIPYIALPTTEQFMLPEENPLYPDKPHKKLFIKHKMRKPIRLFGKPNIEERANEDTYALNHQMSFAAFAQVQRHRTIRHQITGGLELGAPLGAYVPPIVKHMEWTQEWLDDLLSVAEYDFPQGQIVSVAERGEVSHLKAKADERICGPVQLETQENVVEVVNRVLAMAPEADLINVPPCVVKPCVRGGCPTGKKLTLDRIV